MTRSSMRNRLVKGRAQYPRNGHIAWLSIRHGQPSWARPPCWAPPWPVPHPETLDLAIRVTDRFLIWSNNHASRNGGSGAKGWLGGAGRETPCQIATLADKRPCFSFRAACSFCRASPPRFQCPAASDPGWPQRASAISRAIDLSPLAVLRIRGSRVEAEQALEIWAM